MLTERRVGQWKGRFWYVAFNPFNDPAAQHPYVETKPYPINIIRPSSRHRDTGKNWSHYIGEGISRADAGGIDDGYVDVEGELEDNTVGVTVQSSRT